VGKLMFATLSRFRRQIAVLTALAMVASVLVAVPAVAADDPKMDYPATFDACVGVPASDFEDVPANHANAGDIDCIAYYNITRGTSMTTYSPLMSVSREHMALFLTRLADLVGIEMASDPDDAGFTDIGELSAESQTAINQLADLEVTQGTSTTTYSPDDSVKRGHMALFIARLMNHMDPFADPNAADTAAAFAYIPKLVVDVEDDDGTTDKDETKDVMSPFTDLMGSTKEAYDAITALWELGVASGINATSYAPDANITRAAMAEFIAGVLDHSNARPAGVTMQVDETTDFGDVMAVRAISVRDDSFAPMADVSVKVFTATESGGIDDDTGKCITDDVCDWSDNAEIANDDGNNFESIDVETDNGEGDEGNMENSETWYAWLGSDDDSEFVKGSSGEAMVTLTAKADALGIRVTSDINEEAANNAADPNQVDVGKDRSVVITAQLIDTETVTDDSNAVAKEGVTLAITRTRGATPDAPGPDDMKTDADGKVTFTIMGPAEPDEGADPVNQDDTVTFQGDVDGDTTDPASPDNETNNVVIRWRSADAAVAEGIAKTDAGYAIIDDDKVRINVTVSYYDQYGNPAASGDRLQITVGDTSGTADTFADSGADGVRVRSNGTARFTANIKADAGDAKAVVVGALATATSIDPTDPAAVLAVRHAHKNDDGVSGNRSDTAADNQVIVDADNDRFIIDIEGTVDGVLYSYDSGDTFVVEDAEVGMDKFEEAIAMDGNTVTVVFYSTNGTSIFSVEATS
nr:S-layer homology domain-containing protein [Acidimicrobiia bacterium]